MGLLLRFATDLRFSTMSRVSTNAYSNIFKGCCKCQRTTAFEKASERAKINKYIQIPSLSFRDVRHATSQYSSRTLMNGIEGTSMDDTKYILFSYQNVLITKTCHAGPLSLSRMLCPPSREEKNKEILEFWKNDSRTAWALDTDKDLF